MFRLLTAYVIVTLKLEGRSRLGTTLFNREIAIDLGTANTLVYMKGKGIVLNEPTVVARHIPSNEILAVGNEAKSMIGRSPRDIEIIRPLKDGVIADFDITAEMIQSFIGRVYNMETIWSRKPHIIICVPSGATKVEKRAVLDAAKQAGAKEVYIISEPFAAAIGAGLPVWEPTGNMIVDIGGGTTEVAIISLGGIVSSQSIRVAGDYLNEEIQTYIRLTYSLAIGISTAEKLKIDLASAKMDDNRGKMVVKGRDLITGLPETVTVTRGEIMSVIEKTAKQIVSTVIDTLATAPPEISNDIMSRGIILTGGGALLDGLANMIKKEVDLPVFITEDPMTSVVKGTGKAIKHIDHIRRTTNIAAENT